MKKKDTNLFPITMQFGTISKPWRNPNLFVTADNQPDNEPGEPTSYEPLRMNKLEKNQEYYLVANVLNEDEHSVFGIAIDFYLCKPSGGIKPEDLNESTRIGQTGGPIFPNTSAEFITFQPFSVDHSGHFCIVAHISTVRPDSQIGDYSEIPTNSKGCIDASAPNMAQRNINVHSAPKGSSAMMFQFNVPAGVNEVKLTRTPLAEGRELLEDSGMAHLEHEAEEVPRFEFYRVGESTPIEIIARDRIASQPTIDLSRYQNIELSVRVELPQVDQENTGAIYTFSDKDDTEGLEMVLSFQTDADEKADKEEKKMEKYSDAWWGNFERYVGKRRANRFKERWEARRQKRQAR